jgi:hypothetical protein
MFKALEEERNLSPIFFNAYLERDLECCKEIFWD